MGAPISSSIRSTHSLRTASKEIGANMLTAPDRSASISFRSGEAVPASADVNIGGRTKVACVEYTGDLSSVI